MKKLIIALYVSSVSAGCIPSKASVAPSPDKSPASKTQIAVQNMPLNYIILHKRMQTGDYRRFAMKSPQEVPEFRRLVKERYEASRPQVEALERQLRGQEVEEVAIRVHRTPKSRRRHVRFPKNLR